MRIFKRARNARYEVIDFLEVFFLSKIIGRSIYDTSKMLNKYLLSKKKGKPKIFTDRRKKRSIPHQTGGNKYLRKIGLNKARNILRECLDTQLKEALDQGLMSNRVNVLINFIEHPYYGMREDKMIKGTNRQKRTIRCAIT